MIQHQDFQFLNLLGPNDDGNNKQSSSIDYPKNDISFYYSKIKNNTNKSNNNPTSTSNSGPVFADVDSLLDFMTKRWNERWVTTDIWDNHVLDRLLQRPFFLLVSVDAPLGLRWKRFSDR